MTYEKSSRVLGIMPTENRRARLRASTATLSAIAGASTTFLGLLRFVKRTFFASAAVTSAVCQRNPHEVRVNSVTSNVQNPTTPNITITTHARTTISNPISFSKYKSISEYRCSVV